MSRLASAAVLVAAILMPAARVQAASRAHERGRTMLVATATAPKTRASVTLFPGETTGAPLMGLGVEWDPYDSFQPSPTRWTLIERRVSFVSPGFLRVVEPASDYFQGYDASHNPTYRWNSVHVRQLLQILGFAQAHHITVVLGDWADPLIDGDARIPAEFIAQLHDTYRFTDVRYYDPLNEPNYDANCDFPCWTNVMKTLNREFARLGMSWIQLIGPSNGNSWDDTAGATSVLPELFGELPGVQSADRKSGLDTDNRANDAWVTETLQTIPNVIGAYDSHRYASIAGLEQGIYGEQMLIRRDEISNRDSPAKPYFEGEVGLTSRPTDPFSPPESSFEPTALPALVGAAAAPGPFPDSQPHIAEFNYGTWMGDMVIQAVDGGLSGASAWDLDDAMHTGGGYGAQNLKQWGFWNSLGGLDGYPSSDLNPRPWYYAWSVLSRSFPAGGQALSVPTSGLAGVRIAAVRVPRGSRYALSFALVNENSSGRAIKLFVHDVGSAMKLAVYDYFPDAHPTDANGFPAPARIASGVNLARGDTIKLPSQGLVVLSSLGLSSTKLLEGKRTLTDYLTSFGEVYKHSSCLLIDTSNPLIFDGDRSRVTVSTKCAGYVIYRVRHVTSFELKLYAKAGSAAHVYTSADAKRWMTVPLAGTPAAPALKGRGWYLNELLPRGPLGPAELLKIVLPRGVELGQVRIQEG